MINKPVINDQDWKVQDVSKSASKVLCVLLLLLISNISSNGQNKVRLSKDNVEKPKVMPFRKQIATIPRPDNMQIFRCGLRDKAGNLWFGTTMAGVYRYDGKSFIHFTEKNGLSNNCVYTILEDKRGNIWFGTKDGVSRYDGKTFTSVSVTRHDSDHSIFFNTDTYFKNAGNNYYSLKMVVSMLEDKAGNIWFGTAGDGVYRYDGTSLTNFPYFVENANPNGCFRYPAVQSLLEDKSGNIWFGSYRYEMSRVNHPCNKNRCKHDLRVPKDLKAHNQELAKSVTNFMTKEGLTNELVFCALQDKKGNIWFGTRDHGVFRYDGKSFTNLSEKDGLCNNTITCILEDKTGALWFGSDVKDGTRGGGVCRYDGKSFTPFTTKEGLSNNGIWTMVEDKSGNLWIGSKGGGLCRYDGKSFVSMIKT